jgi:hypothetical protein
MRPEALHDLLSMSTSISVNRTENYPLGVNIIRALLPYFVGMFGSTE